MLVSFWRMSIIPLPPFSSSLASLIKKMDSPLDLGRLGVLEIEKVGTDFRGVVPIGRTAVSKTDGWGFESLHPCQTANVAQNVQKGLKNE